MNAVLLKTLKESLGFAKKRRTVVHTELDHLAGTWSEKDFAEFQMRTPDYEAVDEKMWK